MLFACFLFLKLLPCQLSIACSLIFQGIYRVSGVKSRVEKLCQVRSHFSVRENYLRCDNCIRCREGQEFGIWSLATYCFVDKKLIESFRFEDENEDEDEDEALGFHHK